MDIYEIYNNARDNLKIRFDRTEKEVHDGDYFNMIVEISNPKRSIFNFLDEPSYAYDDLVLTVEETPYTKPRDPSYAEGYRTHRSVDPDEKITMRIPVEAKKDLTSDMPPEKVFRIKVEATLRTNDLFTFDKTNGADPDLRMDS